MKAFASFDQLLEVARKEKPKEGFTSIVSNPPYQMSNENSGFAPAVYHNFAIVSQIITSKYLSMIYPSRWMQGGSADGLIEFRESEIKSNHYVKLFDYTISEDLFSDVSIAGGLNIYLWDKDKKDPGMTYVYNNVAYQRSTISDGSDTVIRDPEVTEKLSRLLSPMKSISAITSKLGPYGMALDKEKEVLDSASKPSTDRILVHYVSGGKHLKISTPRSASSIEVSDYKVGVSKTAHSITGLAHPRADRIFIAGPDEAFSSTFIKIGSFATKQEAANCLVYLKSDFCNFLLAISTPTRDTTARNYALIPRVDFATGEILDKPGTFLDFSKPETLDDQLTVIYDLTEDERNLMTKDLKPWKDKTSVTADM